MLSIFRLLSFVALLFVLTGFSSEVQSSEPSKQLAQPSTSSSSPPSSSAYKQVDLSFERVFAKPIYKKSYFPVVILGASILVAGTLSFITAGAGAPTAATGVSTVASAVGGGGAGSYMAGLSTVGSLFGGNAMLGAAILNGISLGTVGGGTAWTSMTATQRVGVMTSAMAASLDGVLIFSPEGGKELTYRVRLTVPQGFGSDRVLQISKKLERAERDVHKAALAEDQAALNQANVTRQHWLERSRLRSKHVLTRGAHPDDLIVLAVIRKNAGDSEQFEQLIAKLRSLGIAKAGFLDYLEAISLIEQGRLNLAESLLRRSWHANPYAIEPPIVLINLIAHRGFKSGKPQILTIADDIDRQFKRNKYQTNYGPLALNYRLATLYFVDGRYTEAARYYQIAYDSLSWYEKYVGHSEIGNVIKMDLANCYYSRGEMRRGDKLYTEVLDSARTKREQEFLRSRYAKHTAELAN